MKLNVIADFNADFPDDQVDDGDEIIIPGGGGVAEHFASSLAGLSYDLTSPEATPPYGWRFEVNSGRARATIQVTDLGGEFVLHVIERTPFLVRLLNRDVSILPALVGHLH